jgi:Spy/CpxP family protein refolding chaperone
MSTHPLRFAAFASALLILGAALSAQEPGPGFRPGPDPAGRGCAPEFGPAGGRGLRDLHLSEAQQAKVKAIHERHRAAFQAKGEVADGAHRALFEALANPATEAKTLQALHAKASAAQFDLLLEHRAVRQEILPLLTPEQKARFEKGPMGPGPKGDRGPGRGMRPDGPMAGPF